MICIQYQCFLTAEHVRIHSIHVIHLHHILHTAALFRKSNHCRNAFILQILYMNLQFIFLQVLAEQLCQFFHCFLISSSFAFQFFSQVCINSLELDILMFLLQAGDKGTVNIMLQDHCILACFLKHIDILALLNFICHVEDNSLFRFFFLCFILILFCCSVFFLFFSLSFCCLFLILLDAVFQCEIFAVKVFEEYIISHLLSKLGVFDTAIFDKWADVIPVFLIRFTVCLAHSGKFVCYFLGNVLGNLLYKSVILQCTSGYIQRKIRAVDHALKQKQEFRNYFFDIICDKYLIVVQFDRSFDRIILCVDLREVQDTF